MAQRKSNYNEKRKEYVIKYIKASMQRIDIKFIKEDYENFVKPMAECAGLPITSLLKLALAEKALRDPEFSELINESLAQLAINRYISSAEEQKRLKALRNVKGQELKEIEVDLQ